jgi:hypothetical protein
MQPLQLKWISKFTSTSKNNVHFVNNQNIFGNVKLTNNKKLFDIIQSELLFMPINKPEITIAYIADTPGNSTLLTCSRCLVCLALDAEIHYVIPANGTIVHHNVCQYDAYISNKEHINPSVVYKVELTYDSDIRNFTSNNKPFAILFTNTLTESCVCNGRNIMALRTSGAIISKNLFQYNSYGTNILSQNKMRILYSA